MREMLLFYGNPAKKSRIVSANAGDFQVCRLYKNRFGFYAQQNAAPHDAGRRLVIYAVVDAGESDFQVPVLSRRSRRPSAPGG